MALSILLAEDDENDQILIERAFAEAGFQGRIHAVRDGMEAIRFLARTGEYEGLPRNEQPSLLLLDLHMGGSAGADVLAWRQQQPGLRAQLPAVVLSSIEDPTEIARAYQLGANSFLPKPFDFAQLVQLAAQVVRYWLNTNKVAESSEPSGDKDLVA